MSKERCMNVKMDAELVRKAKIVAAMKNITLLKYITELVRPQVESDLATMFLGLAEPGSGRRLIVQERPAWNAKKTSPNA
jgi:hypothetical protein